MELEILRSFSVVATCGSVSRAATRLGFAQPTVSQHVQRLEHALGGRLIERGGSGVILTDLGSRVLPLVRIIIAASDELLSQHPARTRAHWDSR